MHVVLFSRFWPKIPPQTGFKVNNLMRDSLDVSLGWRHRIIRISSESVEWGSLTLWWMLDNKFPFDSYALNTSLLSPVTVVFWRKTINVSEYVARLAQLVFVPSYRSILLRTEVRGSDFMGAAIGVCIYTSPGLTSPHLTSTLLNPVYIEHIVMFNVCFLVY